MTTASKFIGMSPWWGSAAGQHLLAWEQEWFSAAVPDVFGFHALQLGLPALEALRANRMPHRWLAAAGDIPTWINAAPIQHPTQGERAASSQLVGLQCEFDALPFASQSLDLVVMPHTLELARDPHLALREAERVLVPEGRLMITAFNPSSWWALRGSRHRKLRSPLAMKTGADAALAWPAPAEMIGFRRLRDWLRLLSFEVEAARFGRFGPPVDNPVWQERWAWIEPVGQRWWPVFGAVYGLTAVKRVRGMRLVGLAKRQARYAQAPRRALVPTQQGSRRSGPDGD